MERGVIKRDVVIKPAGGKHLVRYTPVTSDAAAKLVISLAALRCWKREQWDIVDAYLNAAIDNGAIFMKQPTGHEFFLALAEKNLYAFSIRIRYFMAICGTKCFLMT